MVKRKRRKRVSKHLVRKGPAPIKAPGLVNRIARRMFGGKKQAVKQ